MGDWFITTEGVKIVKDSAGLWPQITGIPSSRLDKYRWSPQKPLWQCWRKERKSRNEQRLAERNNA
ncbi:MULTISPECIES: hypothetical protein [Serratia]|uniref:hypothetical protein n=1 Tax=Serratia TaxID=613 RepID=UPI001F4C259B|nr:MULTISPECIES: hypothetical protein [Serratia]ULG10945.1 hypothetical protein 220p1_00062 [Serratia entomophila]CAI1942894.1 Uncharacterised protein [Serratia quinivorans]CAI2159818.1 Uncharacterised protein [Serratia quinivorans]